MKRRNENPIQTFSGRTFWPLDPNPADVDVVDIAHALSNQGRFAGHTRVFYSVAEHSVRVANVLETLDVETQLAGLFHDAAEAYLVDLPSPVKRLMPAYCDAEKLVQAAIWTALDLQVSESLPAIKSADEILLATEARDLMPRPSKLWRVHAIPLPEPITPLSHEHAERWFLGRFHQLTNGRQKMEIGAWKS